MKKIPENFIKETEHFLFSLYRLQNLTQFRELGQPKGKRGDCEHTPVDGSRLLSLTPHSLKGAAFLRINNLRQRVSLFILGKTILKIQFFQVT